MPTKRIYAVLLTEPYVTELSEELSPYLKEVKAGKYILCKEMDLYGNFLHMVPIPDKENITKEKNPQKEIYVPHQCVKLILSGVGEESIGFIKR